MRKVAFLFVAIMVGLFLLAAETTFAQKPRHGGKLVIGHDVDAVGLDFHKSVSFASNNYYEQIYNSLLLFDEKGELQPDLAASWDNPDPKTYIFHLRKGVKFHNGNEFSAEDVKATFDRLMDPKTAAVRRANFRALKSVEVVDRYTVQFNLMEPFAPFISYMGDRRFSGIYCKDVIEKADPNNVVVGTGPFQLVEYRPNDRMLLKKNPNYWEKELPYLDELEIRLIKDASSRVAALRAKSVDYIWMVEPQLLPALMKEKDVQSGFSTFPPSRLRVYFNNSKPPFDNVKVRQALSSATDRKEIIRVATMGMAKLSGPLPPSVGEFASPPEKLPFYDYNVERARKLLVEAGYPAGLKAKLKVTPSYPLDLYSAQLLQEQWKKIGVDIELVQVEWGTLLRDAATLNHEILMMWDAGKPDPDDYIRWDVDFNQRAGYQNPDVAKLVREAVITTDRSKRVPIYHEIERKLAELSPIIIAYAVPSFFEFWRDYVKGYVPHPLCYRIYTKQTWLDK